MTSKCKICQLETVESDPLAGEPPDNYACSSEEGCVSSKNWHTLDEWEKLNRDDSNEIELGSGDVIISDIHNVKDKWAGVAFSQGECKVGEYVENGGKTDIEIGAYFRIISTNPKSLDVLINALWRARRQLDDDFARFLSHQREHKQ